MAHADAEWYQEDDDLSFPFEAPPQQQEQQHYRQQQLQQQQQQQPAVYTQQHSTDYFDQEPPQENSRGNSRSASPSTVAGAVPSVVPSDNLFPGIDMENMSADDIIEVVTLLDSGLFLGTGALGTGTAVYDSAMACY